MHKGNDESNGAEYFLAALLAESSPLRVAEESIRYKVKALWSLLRPLEQNDDSSQLGALSAFVERLDSQDIVDRARPLRALPSNAGVHGQQQGDAHVMALLCQVLLTACFPRFRTR